MGFVKIILFVSNLIFVIAGAALFFLGLAVWLKLLAIKALDIDVSVLQTLVVFAIVVSGITLFIAFLGCCGAIQENNCMLTTYSIFMLLLTAMSVAVAIPFFIKQGQATQVLVEGLKFTEQNHTAPQNYTLLHTVENTLKCCGLNGPKFYVNRTTVVNETLGTINTWSLKNLPPSCCETSQNKPTSVNCDLTNARSIGCEEIIPSKAITIGLVLSVVACIELLAAVLGLYLKKETRNAPKYW